MVGGSICMFADIDFAAFQRNRKSRPDYPSKATLDIPILKCPNAKVRSMPILTWSLQYADMCTPQRVLLSPENPTIGNQSALLFPKSLTSNTPLADLTTPPKTTCLF